jgi:hypothetical protein
MRARVQPTLFTGGFDEKTRLRFAHLFGNDGTASLCYLRTPPLDHLSLAGWGFPQKRRPYQRNFGDNFWQAWDSLPS